MKIPVLVADDHSMIRNGLRKILDDTPDLECAGEAWDGPSLLVRLGERDWGLLVLDLSMPGRNGLELIKRVKDLKPRLPILVFTMHQEEQYAVRALHAGAHGYLTKEHDADVMLAAMRKVASGGIYVSGHVAELLARDLVRPGLSPPHTTLSNREFEVFTRLANGSTPKHIAEEFSLSIKTVSTHKAHVQEKLGLGNQSDLIRYALRHGLVDAVPDEY